MEKLLLRSNFSSFHNIFNISLASAVKLHINFLNVVVRFIFFLNSANLICRGSDISKYFRESLGLRDDESRLYLYNLFLSNIKCRQFEVTRDGVTITVQRMQNSFWKTLTSDLVSLRKHAYSKILKISSSKTESFQIKILIFFSYFCSKPRLWVPTIYVLEQK